MTLQLNRKKSTSSGIPLDDINGSLYESYLRSHWYHDQSNISVPSSPIHGNPSPLGIKSTSNAPSRPYLPLYLYTALLRVAVMPWTEAPQTVADTFLERLMSADALSKVFSVAPDEHKLALARALSANNQLASELQLQSNLIFDGSFPGVSSSEDGLSTEAYSEWSKSALKEVQALLQRYARLPEFNGAMSLTIVKAAKIVSAEKKIQLCPYVVVDLKDHSGNKVAEKMATSVRPNTSSPLWQTSFSPHLVEFEGCEVLMKVKSCAKGTEPLPGRDKTLLHSGIRLASGGLFPGMPMTINIPLYGPAATKSSGGGLCFCFGGGGLSVEADEGDLAPHTPGAGGKASGGTKHMIFDPFLNTFEGVSQGLVEQGSLEVILTYYYETRVRDRRGENPLSDGRGLEFAGSMHRRAEEAEDRNSVLKKSKSRGRGKSEAGGPSPSLRVKSIEGLSYKQYLQSILVHPLDIPSSLSISNVSMAPSIAVKASHCYDSDADVLPNSMFRNLASSLFAAHRSLSRLEPFYAQYQSPESSPRGRPSPPASPGESSSSLDTTILASILAISPPKSICELIEDPKAKLPFGWGLLLLIQFAKLYRIRPETQRLIILQYMLLQYDPVKLDTMTFFRSAWEPCLFANINGSLTSDEVHGLRAVMSLFLSKAVPALNNHYAMYNHSEGVEAFSLLIEMVGWSLTWNPEAEPPISSLQETLARAVKKRLMAEFKVGGSQLPEAIHAATEEIKIANDDLRRDILIQEELPGLEGFLKTNAHLRYNILTDHLEMLVAYQPGGSTASMNLFFKLEEELLAHHKLLIRHDLAALPDHVIVDEDGGDEQDLISIWDIESPMIASLEQWIRNGGAELGQRCPRLLEAEKWEPISGSQRMGHSSIELLRLVNTSLESWVRSALGGGLRRKEAVGAVIVSCLTDLLSFYAREFFRFWEPMLSSRSFLSEASGANDQRLTAAVLFSAGPFEPNSFPSLMNLASAQKPQRESLNGKAPEIPPSPSMRLRSHHRAAPSFGDGGSMGGLDALGDALEAFGVTGVTLTEQMCTLIATLIQLIDDCKVLGLGLSEVFISKRKSPKDSATIYGPEWLDGPWNALIRDLETILSSIITSYSIHFRETLVKIFVSAFGNKPSSEISVKSLEGILSTIYDEVGCMMRGAGAKKNSKLPPTSSKTLMDLSDAAWRGAIGAIQQLALNQAQGFRPLTKVEAEWAKDFLDSLQSMFAEELPEGFSPHQRANDLDSGLAIDLVAQRLSSHAYCSALLQALSADTSDLLDLYEAQFSCLQQARSAVEGSVFIELGTSQVSLLDLLRLLRQRRKVDSDSAQFVIEQLKKAEPIVTQVVFGMTGNERLLAEFPCFLVPSSEPVSQRLAPQSFAHKRTSSFGASHLSAVAMAGTPVGRGFGTVASSVQGRLYLTQSTVSFTTLFDFDLKGNTDQTMVVLKSKVASTQSPTIKSLMIKTKDLETYSFSGFSPGDRERLQGLLSSAANLTAMKPRHTRHASVDDKEKRAPQGPVKVENSASRFEHSTPAKPSRLKDSSPARQPQQCEYEQVTPPSTLKGGELVQSVPCYLYGAIRNRDGVLHLYTDRFEFSSSQQQQILHSVPLRDIEHIGQRQINSSMLGIGSGTSGLMSFQVSGLAEPLLFGGIGTDALMFHLKQTISELCFSAG